MAGKYRCEVILYWSDQDQAFIAEVPELPGCTADGATYQETAASVETVIQEWIETAQELGRSIPAPKGRLVHARPFQFDPCHRPAYNRNLLEDVVGKLPEDKAAILGVIDRYLSLPDKERPKQIDDFLLRFWRRMEVCSGTATA